MANTTTRTISGTADLAALRKSLMEESRQLLQRAREIEEVLRSFSTPSRPAKGGVREVAPPRPAPLDKVKGVIAATSDLRVDNGNLSAELVATIFGLSLSQLAAWLGRSRQTISKTPDADSLQDQLAFFERVARLRAVVSKDRFRKWLRIPNPELDDKKPLDLLASGEWQVVADLVDDMMTGAPA